MIRRLSLLAIAWVSIGLSGCDMQDYVPATDDILKSGGLENSFLVEAKNVRGVYGNMDVSCGVYSYETALSSSPEFWTELEKNLNNDEWTRISDVQPNIRQYVLLIPPEEPGHGWSIVGATVGLNPDNNNVGVGFVFTTTRSKPASVRLPSLEAGFAEERVWPKIKEIISAE